MLVTPVSSRGFGWRQDVRDFRDHTVASDSIRQQLLQLPLKAKPTELPDKVDLREYFPPVDDQQTAHSSAAQACLSMAEYFQFRCSGLRHRASRMFVYYASRKLVRLSGDSGADLRSTLKAMKCFGSPLEEYWPYDVERVNDVPDAILFQFANPYSHFSYFRLDLRNSTGKCTLDSLKRFLAAGFAVSFGFPVPSSISESANIPYRPAYDSIRGGQAVVAVGYNDRWLGATRGAILVRNSWGPGWGDNGYGWLPYRYVEEQLAADFWTLSSQEFNASSELSCPVD